MTITLELGWWLLPFAITVILVPITLINLGRRGNEWDLLAPVAFLLAVIFSLVAWLIWAVLS